MLKTFVMGATFAALLSTAAFAQTAPVVDPAAKPAVSADSQVADNNGPGDDQQDGGWFGWGKHGRRGQHGGPGMGGPGGPGMMGGRGGPGMMQGKGFGLMLGNGQGLRINCGNEPMKQCIEAAQPLFDALNKANPGQPPVVAPKTP
ncbi:MAG: hypothetical protein KGO94_12590 [Alphaproteobacteria bacterium]|nr:hypothetical protein [Alphaproteobacteria bacterium]